MEMETIKITHFINPHVFWYTKPKERYADFEEFDEVLQTGMSKRNKNASSLTRLIKSHMLAAFHNGFNKYIRVRVEKVISDDECVVWAPDYGRTARRFRKQLHLIPKEFCQPVFEMVFLGGIHGIQPNDNETMWPEETLQATEDILNGKCELVFVKQDQKGDMHHFGDVWVVKTAEEPLHLREYLVGCGLAKMSNNFAADMAKISYYDLDGYDKHVPSLLFPNRAESVSPKKPVQREREERTVRREVQVNGRPHHQRPPKSADFDSDDVSSGDENSRNAVNRDHSNGAAVVNHKMGLDLSIIEPNCVKSKIHMTPLLVHGTFKVNPIETKYAAQFTEAVQHHLRNYSELYATQAYAWPHITRNNSLILVDSKGNGKTMAYVPAICSLVQRTLEGQDASDLPTPADPIAIIITPTVQAVSDIASLCRRFMTNKDKATGVVEAEVNEPISKIMCKIYNRCDIFVSTPKVFVQLLKNNPYLMKDQSTIEHVVLDNIDVAYEKFKSEYQEIFKWQRKMAGVQTVITSRTWRPLLLECARRIQNPLLLIGHHIETNFYARAEINVHFETEEHKKQNILKHLKECNYSTEKTIIVCNEDVTVAALSELFKQHKVNYVAFDSESSDLNRTYDWCMDSASGRYAVLICTDSILYSLNIRCAENVIHFELPNRLGSFVFRFSATIDRCHNYIADNVPKSRPPRMVILISDNNANMQLPKIIDLLDRYCPNKVPASVLKLAERERNTQDGSSKATIYQPICNNYVTTGQWECEVKCLYRHWLSPTDAPPADYPLKGLVRIKLFHAHSPTHFTVRIMLHKPDMEAPWIPVNQSDQYSEFIMKFAAQYQKSDDLQPVGKGAKAGDLCVVFYDMVSHRCQIIKRNEKSDSRKVIYRDEDDIVDLRLIDTGKLIKFKLSELYKLDPEYCDFPGQAVDLHLTGIIPVETVWHKPSINKVRSLLTPFAKSENREIEVNVIHALKNALIIDQMRVVEKLELTKEYVMLDSVKKVMIHQKYGTADKTAFAKFEKALQDRGLQNTSELQNGVSETKD